MNATAQDSGFTDFGPRRFPGTPWTDLLLAQGKPDPRADAALNRLCTAYWYPVYAHIRDHIPRHADAEDLTQEFFASLLRRRSIDSVDRARGKFRSFLLTAVKRFLINARKRASAAKRGGGQIFISLDEEDTEKRYLADPTINLSPENAFDLRWKQTLLEHALARLRGEYARRGREAVFDTIKGYLDGKAAAGDYAAAGVKLGMTSNAVAVEVNRLKTRLHQVIFGEIRQTVPDLAQAREELSELFGS